ncbi:mCG146962 [Mus musculus]|nr:mCG146962 [Mus musculus]
MALEALPGLLCQAHHSLWTHNEMAGTSRYGRDEDRDKPRKWCLYFFHRTTPSHAHPVTELPPALQERLADPGQPHLQGRCWKQESPSFSFRAPVQLRDQIEDMHGSSQDNGSDSQGKPVRIE